MNMIVSISALLICVLVFLVITGVNPKIEMFIIVLMVMNGANCYLFTKFGRISLEESLQVSGVSLFYVTHFMHRLGLATQGNRLDITKSDYIYAALINFMDVPYYIVGILNYFLPIAKWASLNEDTTVRCDKDQTKVKKDASKKDK